jgi:hypothetical protein
MWMPDSASFVETRHDMRTQGFPVVVDLRGVRINAGFRAPSTEKPVLVAVQLRDQGWKPYKISFDPLAGAWVALVMGDNSSSHRAED